MTLPREFPAFFFPKNHGEAMRQWGKAAHKVFSSVCFIKQCLSAG